MGWKGTVKSVRASIRAAEREAQKSHRAALREQAAYEKELDFLEAEEAVENWEEYISQLVSVHISNIEPVDWQSIKERQKPTEPAKIDKNVRLARKALEKFKPSFIERIFNSGEKRKAQLEKDLADAPAKDEEFNSTNGYAYAQQTDAWQNETTLARRVLEYDPDAIGEAIQLHQTLSDEELIGSKLSFGIEGAVLYASVTLHNDEIVPKFRRKQLASGKLSETNMPPGQFHQLYQDYVASVALRVVREMFAILPLDDVIVTCSAIMLNTSTGHDENTPILSVQCDRQTFELINMRGIDPSDSLRNFEHRMNFKKTKGFSAVNPIGDE